jgi:chromosome segregation ATPase
MGIDPEVHESLRAECEALKHRQAAIESDFARVESLKEKVSALVWENDSLKENAQAARAQLERYKGLAIAFQRGLVTWKSTPEARQFRAEEGDNLRWLNIAQDLADEAHDKPILYAGLVPMQVPK